MMNRQQIHSELEQLLIQNQQKDEFLMMLMAINKQNLLSEQQYIHHLQSYPQLSLPNGYFGNNYQGHHPHLGFNPQMGSHHLLAQQIHSPHHHPLLNFMAPPQTQNLQSNLSGQNGSNTSRISNGTHTHQYLNNPTSETNLLIPEQNNKFSDLSQSKHMSHRDSETKKNLELSDFSMQLEESTTRISLNRNSFGFQSQPQQQASKQLNMINQIGIPQIKQQCLFNKQEDDIDTAQRADKNIKDSSYKQNYACGYKYIQKGENSNSCISKIQKNPLISRLADSLTYIYTFDPSRLETDGVLEELFLVNNKQQNESNKGSKSDCEAKALINTTIIQLNNKNCDDPLGNLTTEHLFETGQKQSKIQQNQQQLKMQTPLSTSMNTPLNSIDQLTFSTDFLTKTFNLTTQNFNQAFIKEENDDDSDHSDYIEEKKSGAQINESQKFIKKGLNSLRFNSRLVNTIENFLKNKLMYSSNPSKEEDSNDNKENRKSQSISEKIKGLKGLLDFEDVTAHVSLETNMNEDALKKEVQSILHHFKSNHKIYFKKVRSQKEMLKDTKFHNLNKRIMRVLLQILNNPIILQLKVPKPIFNFFNTMSTKLVNSSKKLIKNTIVNDQYSHAHYNTMFLQISAQNYQKLNQSQSDIDLHKIIYNIDLTLPYSHNYFEIQKTNILKQYIFLILDRTLRLNDISKDTSIQSIRSMYIERVIKGMEKMNAGKIVQRF